MPELNGRQRTDRRSRILQRDEVAGRQRNRAQRLIFPDRQRHQIIGGVDTVNVGARQRTNLARRHCCDVGAGVCDDDRVRTAELDRTNNLRLRRREAHSTISGLDDVQIASSELGDLRRRQQPDVEAAIDDLRRVTADELRVAKRGRKRCGESDGSACRADEINAVSIQGGHLRGIALAEDRVGVAQGDDIAARQAARSGDQRLILSKIEREGVVGRIDRVNAAAGEGAEVRWRERVDVRARVGKLHSTCDVLKQSGREGLILGDGQRQEVVDGIDHGDGVDAIGRQ